MRARAFDELIHIDEIKLPFGALDLLPVNGGFNGVSVESGHGIPYLRKFAGPGAGVVNLSAENEERLAVHQKCESAIFLDQLGSIGREGRGQEKQCNNSDDEK